MLGKNVKKKSYARASIAIFLLEDTPISTAKV
jgi:hypothetical protein